mgnify:CR=1 FL=1|jgi:hypothetical protein
MKVIDFCIKFPIFWLFFALLSAPLFLAIVWTPSKPAWVGHIDALFGLLWWVSVFVLAPWAAAVAAWRNAFKYDSMRESVLYILDRVRVFLSFLPIVGLFFVPRRDLDPEDPTPIE